MAFIDTVGALGYRPSMANRQTKNVSLTAQQDQFVQHLVSTGRYRTVSEVVRDGLRLLEQAEHRRLLEKWIYDDLTEEERDLIPPDARARVEAHFRKLVDDGIRSAESQGWMNAGEVMARLAAKLPGRLDDEE